MNDSKTTNIESRADIIKSVTTPLGFFALAMLILEAILFLLASRAAKEDFTFLLWGTIGLTVLLVLIVAYISFKKPSLLLSIGDKHLPHSDFDGAEVQGWKSRAEILTQETVQLQARIKTLTVELTDLTKKNEILYADLNRLNSLKKSIWALFNQGDSVDVNFILRNLGIENNRVAQDEILSLIGLLVEEGRIEGDTMKAPGSYRLKK